MPKIQKAMKSDFTMVHNTFLKDRRLNSSSREVLMTMLSKPNDYKFTIRGLANEMSDGVTSVSSSLNRLEKFIIHEDYLEFTFKSGVTVSIEK